jgi:prolyl-tRNA synthetase
MVAGWCGGEDCEAKVKAETKATIRFLPRHPGAVSGTCIVCGQPAAEEATWALAY